MKDYEKQIEEAAELIPEKLGWPNDGTAEGNDIKLAFIAGAKSEAAKAFHQQGMYTKEDVQKLVDIIQWYDDESDVRPNYSEKGEATMWDFFEQFKKKP
jgi:hypothetical protein